jgi:hydroxymethylbilane synthase
VSSNAARPLRLGTRRSALAMAQSQTVADALTAHTGRPVELVEITTAGDRSSAPITSLGTTGVFVSALRDALLAGDIDLAVHSAKDLPTAPADGLVVAATPLRADPRDVLIARDGLTLSRLPAGATVGTGAPRRIAQLRAYRPDLEPTPIRGNVDTRLGKVTGGHLDAVVLAHAGLARLGRLDEVTEVLDPAVVLPAPAQGALAVECRSDDHAVVALLAAVDDPATHLAVVAERTTLATLEAGCSAPVAALGVVTLGAGGAPGTLTLHGSVTALDGGKTVRLTSTTALRAPRDGTATPNDDARADAASAGRRLAVELVDAGAADLMGSHP